MEVKCPVCNSSEFVEKDDNGLPETWSREWCICTKCNIAFDVRRLNEKGEIYIDVFGVASEDDKITDYVKGFLAGVEYMKKMKVKR